MHRLVDVLANFLLKEEIVDASQLPWIKYGLEKRISTLLVGIPFLLLAFMLTSIPCGIFFFISYFFVRKYVGGYHAQTMCGCLFFSLFSELVLLIMLYPIQSIHNPCFTTFICTILVFLLAPYNHPNLHLNIPEISACKKRSRIRIITTAVFTQISFNFGLQEIATGCTLGITLASFLLCLGYINDWRK